MIEKEIQNSETEQKQSATDEFVMALDIVLWRKLSNLTETEKYNRWVELTQQESTESKEIELIMLNHLFTHNMLSLEPNLVQRGLYFNSDIENGKQRLDTLENLINNTKEEIEKHFEDSGNKVPFNILVSGVGISGKTTIRSVIAKELNKIFPKYLISQADNDYQDIDFVNHEYRDKSNVINMVEDIHGLDDDKYEPNSYDMIIYVLPTNYNRKLYFGERDEGWKKVGIHDLTAQQHSDNLDKTIEEQSSEWRKRQIQKLKEIKDTTIAIIIPSEIIKSIYDIGKTPNQ